MAESLDSAVRGDPGRARSAYGGQRNGAEDGTRTRDPHLGKVMLYQLSHFRSGAARAGDWCREPDSNWRHRDFQSRALPTELSRPGGPGGPIGPDGVAEDSTGGSGRAIAGPRGRLAGGSSRAAGAGSQGPAAGQSRPVSGCASAAGSGASPVSARSRLMRSMIGGWVENIELERSSNFLIGFVK